MRAAVRNLLKRAIARTLRVYGYEIINPADRFGIGFIADVKRLSQAWNVEVGTIFDVGANIGTTALAFRSAWPNAGIVAFEPNVAVAQRLQDNLAGARNVSVQSVALSDRSGRSRFHVYDEAPDLSSLNAHSPYVARFGVKGAVVDVDTMTLDEFCLRNSIPRINILKVDTEGSDYKVIRGAERLLGNRSIDFVYCEFNTFDGGPDDLGSLAPIGRFLGACGYHFIASYNDYITMEGEFFSVSNALFATRSCCGVR